MIPPNIAALFSPTVVSEKLEHGGGACPVTTGELHPSGGDKSITNYMYERFLMKLKGCKDVEQR